MNFVIEHLSKRFELKTVLRDIDFTFQEGKIYGLLGPNGELSDIQQAFVEEAAIQCGFCTPGIILSAVEIVGTGRTYTREELRKLISGHLCRCTGYQNILNAVEKAVNVCNGYVGEKQS